MGSKKVIFNLIIVIMVGLFFYLLVVGCERINTAKQNVTLAVWGTPEELKIIRDTIKEWKIKEKPDFDVMIEHIPWDSYLSKLQTEIAGNSAPDVIACETSFLPKFIEVKALEPLDKFIKNDKSFNIKEYYKTIIDAFSYKGELYVLPRDISPVCCIYYNKALFDRAGLKYPKDDWDYAQFLDIAKKLTKRLPDGRIEVYGFLTGFWDNFVYNNGGRFVDSIKKPTKSMINRKEFRDGLKFYYDLSYKYKVAPDYKALNKIDSGEVELFKMGRVAMLGSGIWISPTLRLDKKLEWDVAMWPRVKKGKNISVEIGGTGYAILKTSKNKERAWILVKVLAGKLGQRILAKTGLAMPANKVIAEGPDWKLDTKTKPYNKKILNEALKYENVYFPFLSEWPEIMNKYINTEMDKLMNSMETFDNVINNMDQNVNKALREIYENNKGK